MTGAGQALDDIPASATDAVASAHAGFAELVGPSVLALAERDARFGVWCTNLSTLQTTLSASAAALSGYEAAPITVPVGDLMARAHPEDRARVESSAIEATATNAAYDVDFRVLVGSAYRWRRILAQPPAHRGGAPVVIGGILDIHDQRLLHEQLVDSSHRLALAEEIAEFGLWRLDLTQGTMWLSAGAAALSGLARIETTIPGSDLAQRIHPDDRERMLVAGSRAAGGLDAYREEFRVMASDGAVRWVRSQGRLDYSNGVPTHVIGAIIDTTREHDLFEQLQLNASRLQLAEQVAHFGIWEADVRTSTMTLSEGMLALLGLPPGTPLQFPISEFQKAADPSQVAAAEEASKQSLRTGQSFEIESAVRTAAGDTRWHRIHGRPIYEGGQPARTIGATLDVTHERHMLEAVERSRQQAEAAARAKADFLANMSHEIRTPMNGVIGMTTLLLDTDLTAEQRDYAEVVRSSAESLLTIINDILDFSKIEAGKLAIELFPFDLLPLFEDVADMLAPAAHAKGLDLIVRCPSSMPQRFVGDADRIRQVVVNLANNAIKFTDRGHVLMSAEWVTESGDPRCRITVSDTGIGIDPAAQDDLFEKFTQADTSSTRKYGGTGLGLAISKQLVSLMHGNIGVTSVPGEGSTFWFELPLTVDPALAAVVPMPALAGTRVLIVDDNPIGQRVLQEQVAAWHMRPLVVSSAAEALQAVGAASHGSDPFRVVVSDYQMPEMDGLALAAALRADPSHAGLAFVLLTSLGHWREHDADGRGVDVCLVKPVRQSRLAQALTSACAAHVPVRREAPLRHSTTEVAGDFAALGARVLIVEDNPTSQRVAVAHLSRMGVRADVAAHGREAIELLKMIPYDLVLMDCHMPEMTGYETTEAIRAMAGPNRTVPIVALSADVVPANREMAAASGMDDFIAKPVRPEALAAALTHWVADRRSAT